MSSVFHLLEEQKEITNGGWRGREPVCKAGFFFYVKVISILSHGWITKQPQKSHKMR